MLTRSTGPSILTSTLLLHSRLKHCTYLRRADLKLAPGGPPASLYRTPSGLTATS